MRKRPSDRINEVAEMALKEAQRQMVGTLDSDVFPLSDLVPWATVIFRAYINEGIRSNGKENVDDN